MRSGHIPCFWLLALVVSLWLDAVSCIRISLPDRCRSEGRITLSYKQDGQTIKHHMAFTESIDSKHLRSAISIGYVSHEPAKYYARAGSPVISVDTNGLCTAITGGLDLIPELSWFFDHLMPHVNLSEYLGHQPHLVGPSGLFAVLERLNNDNKDTKWQKDGAITYRNIPCQIHSKTVRVPGQNYQLKFEVYYDSRLEKIDKDLPYFTLVLTTLHDKSSNLDRPIEETSATIDFYHIVSADVDGYKFEEMRDEFNLPLGRACSEFLEPVALPESLKSKIDSFSMNFERNSEQDFVSEQDYVLLAYDHRTNFLRREIQGKSASVWDLNEDLMYHTESGMRDRVTNHMKSCSVTKIASEDLGAALRPYEVAGSSMDVLTLLGANKIKFMGRGTVRNIPCRIYETILPEAPYIFGLMESSKKAKSQTVVNHDYIVQFHTLDGSPESLNEEEAEHKKLPSDQFWPAKIILYKRHKDNDLIELIDWLEVYDFHWSLFGWDKKAVELFMSPSCFNDEDEQVRLNLMISFDKIHDVGSKPEDKLILVFNKFRLEYELMQQVLKLFDASQAHLVEYELKLRQNHVNLNLVLADRRKANSLAFQGHGKLPDSYEKEALMTVGLNEEACIKQASLIDDISVVMYCEPGTVKSGESLCSSVTGVSQPSIENDSPDSTGPKCRVYRFYPYGQMIRSTSNLMTKATQLYDLLPSFEANLPNESDKTMKLTGRVMDYDISHEVSLTVINHYAFSLPQDQIKYMASEDAPVRVRSFESYPVESEADCSRLCNLDVTCRSYSYCSQTADEQPCLLSTMDLREAELQAQLVRIREPVKEGQILTVKADRKQNEINIKFADKCDIYERNQLNMFRQTDEIIYLQYSMAKQFEPTPTTFECAERSVNMELKMPDHHLAMFAYCAATSTCLLDEGLFESGKVANAADNTTGRHVLCRVYRKKYQTYFKVSALVLKRDQANEQQVELTLQSVEECARACWIKFGHVCTSFDYAPGSCLINQVVLGASDTEWEVRHNYLHYERDLNLDRLRREHMIGKHKLLDTSLMETRSFWSKVWSGARSLITYALVLAGIFYGLALGKRVNDKLESVTILRQSISAGAGIRASQLSEFSRFNNPVTDNELYGESNAIRMEDIRTSS